MTITETPAPPMTAIQVVFARALESFEQRGWAIACLENPDGQRCVLGHIAAGLDIEIPASGETSSVYAALDDEDAVRFFAEANGLSHLDGDTPVGDVWRWNDCNLTRAAADVKAALVRAFEAAS